MTGEESGGGKRRRSMRDQLIDVAIRSVHELWQDLDGTPYATIPVGGHLEHWPLGSAQWQRWLSGTAYILWRSGVSGTALRDATTTLCGRAAGEAQHEVYVRIAAHGGAIYLDLGDAAWHAVEITAKGWQVVSDPPVRFRRPDGLRPLPSPERGGTIDELRGLLNVSARSWPLLLGWLAGALRPRGPYPVLVLVGEHGSAKSTAARLLRSLIDPSAAPLRSPARHDQDLLISAKNSHILALDNLSALPQWLSDAMCRLATGGGFATRKLWTDDSETIIEAQRPQLVTGIDVPLPTDLADRSLRVELEAIADHDRVPESTIDATMDAIRPRVLGALLDTVATAISREPTVQLASVPRMADYARWLAAAEPAVGYPLLDPYMKAARDAVATSTADDPVAAAILVATQSGRPIIKTAEELRSYLGKFRPGRLPRSWPRDGTRMGRRLKQVAPGLRQAGVIVEQLPRQAGRRNWCISRRGAYSHQTSTDAGDASDDAGAEWKDDGEPLV